MNFFNSITEWLRGLLSKKEDLSGDPSENSHSENREKIIAFSIAFFISISLWFIVNLNRDFNVTIEVPVQIASLPENEIVSTEIPDHASVTVSGEGWNIISVYNNPPQLLVTAQNEDVNLSEQMRNQISAFSDLNIIQVQPATMTVRTEEKATKKVPVVSRVELQMRERFGLLNDPVITPDSVIISGTNSAIDTVSEWQTQQIRLTDLNSDIQRAIELRESGSGLTVNTESVTFQVQIAEFTEAEVRVPIRTLNMPAGRAVTYNPSSVTVRFDVPLNQYSQVQDRQLFRAIVDFSIIEEDSSGRVEPAIEKLNQDYNIRIRNFQPPRVSYFRVVTE